MMVVDLYVTPAVHPRAFEAMVAHDLRAIQSDGTRPAEVQVEF